jgi:hypothetical protein
MNARFRLRCPTRERLLAFLDGHVVGREARRLSAHVAVCETCEAVVLEAGELATICETLRGSRTPPEAAGRMQDWTRLMITALRKRHIAGGAAEDATS